MLYGGCSNNYNYSLTRHTKVLKNKMWPIATIGIEGLNPRPAGRRQRVAVTA